jgi:inward rectifier potassium channel
MQKPSFDPGLTQQYAGALRRTINPDGTFNVLRRGENWRDYHLYLNLVSAPWPKFLAIVLCAYLIVNGLFATLFFSLGPTQLRGAEAPTEWSRFLNDFFFSSHTLTTVGYGNITPVGVTANLLAMLEAMAGLMGFAIATGLLFGRFSRPSARIGFSERMLVAPYQEGMSLQFRVVNRRPNVLTDIQANILLMTVRPGEGQPTRKYEPLTLERPTVYFFPLTWTVVHPIDESSPLWGKSASDLEKLQAEFLILIKGFDDTFSQTVNARYSYRYEDVEWGARFTPAFSVDQQGELVLNVDQVGRYASLGG